MNTRIYQNLHPRSTISTFESLIVLFQLYPRLFLFTKEVNIANQNAFAISSSLIGRLDVCWLTTLAASCYPDVIV